MFIHTVQFFVLHILHYCLTIRFFSIWKKFQCHFQFDVKKSVDIFKGFCKKLVRTRNKFIVSTYFRKYNLRTWKNNRESTTPKIDYCIIDNKYRLYYTHIYVQLKIVFQFNMSIHFCFKIRYLCTKTNYELHATINKWDQCYKCTCHSRLYPEKNLMYNILQWHLKRT